MRIHKEGKFILIFSALSVIVLNVLVWNYLCPIIGIAVTAISIIILALLLNFFREPLFQVDAEENAILSPAYGKVVLIEKVQEPEFLHQEMLQISVFMSPLDIHCNYSPINGKVNYYKYHPGKYLVAWHPKSSLLNERTTLVVEHSVSKKNIVVKQIAGFLARRIVCYADKGSAVNQGREFGFIKFGSRVDVLLPLDVKVHVQVGDKVKGGQHILASFS